MSYPYAGMHWWMYPTSWAKFLKTARSITFGTLVTTSTPTTKRIGHTLRTIAVLFARCLGAKGKLIRWTIGQIHKVFLWVCQKGNVTIESWQWSIWISQETFTRSRAITTIGVIGAALDANLRTRLCYELRSNAEADFQLMQQLNELKNYATADKMNLPTFFCTPPHFSRFVDDLDKICPWLSALCEARLNLWA